MCRPARRVGGLPASTALGVVILGLVAATAVAGGGPENVLLVVNANSDDSKTIANHYIQLRQIPASNVLYVDWKGGVERASADSFRKRILAKVLQAVQQRRLTPQIDYVVYSSDFPWRLDIRSFFPEGKAPPGVRPFASLTGATYLWQFVKESVPAITSPATNWYAPDTDAKNLITCQEIGRVQSRGFRSRYAWTPNGSRAKGDSPGQHYLLSTMLGVTSGSGNTVQEVVSYLQRAALADGTRPRGTVYFMKNNNVRSQTRHECYDEIAAQLVAMGVSARVVKGTIPRRAKDIIGLTVGTARFDLASADDTILPGAICEHLTSLGGVLQTDSGQTPLTEFLRYGAAGASGTVAEPGAVQAKFPLPSLHLHYARGCSLAESFYQSVTGPYLLLIVGDPLCQPWAVFPDVTVEGVEPGQEVHGILSITPSGTQIPEQKVAVFECFVDGRLVARSLPGRTLSLDTAQLADGYHELRVVGIAGSRIETQGRAIVPIQVNNHDRTIELSVVPGDEAAGQFAIKVAVRQPGAEIIYIVHNGRKLAHVDGAEGEALIPTAVLGRGPVALQAVSEGQTAAVSAPVWVHVR